MARESANVIIQATDKATRTLKKISKSFGKLRHNIFEVTATISSGMQIAQGFTRALQGLGRAAAVPIRAAIEQEKVERQLEAVLRSTGEAAGLSKDALLELATGYQKVTAFGDEAVIGMENILLTFTNIGGEGGIFEKVTETTLDMAAALGTDLKNQAIQVGKALNDPILGLSALQRVGVTFTVEQKKVIKHLSETNRVALAQGIILDELAKEFGGSARAAVDTFAGSLAQLNNAWGDSLEAAGRFITENAGVRAILRDIGAQLQGLTADLDAANESTESQVKSAELLQTVLSGLLGAFQTINAAIAGFADAMIEIIVMVAEFTDSTLPMTASQRELNKELTVSKRELRAAQFAWEGYNAEVMFGFNQSEATQKKLAESVITLAAAKKEVAGLTVEFNAAGWSSIRFGAAADFANDQLEELRETVVDVDVRAEIMAAEWDKAADGMREAFSQIGSGAKEASAALAENLENPLKTFLDEIKTNEDLNIATALAEKLIEEEDRIIEALARPVSAGFSQGFQDALLGESLTEGFAEFFDTFKEQMAEALIEPIFGAESAFGAFFESLLSPIRAVGKTIGDAIFGKVAAEITATTAAEIAAMETVATAQVAIQSGAAASTTAISQASVLAMMPALSAAAAAALIATFGGAGANVALLPGLLATAQAAGTAAAITPFAKGALITTPTLGLVGEAGTELILPLSDPRRTRDLLGEALQFLGGRREPSGTAVTFQQTIIAGDADPEEVAEAVADRVDRILGQEMGRFF